MTHSKARRCDNIPGPDRKVSSDMTSIATTTKRLEEIIWDKVPGTDESFPARAAQDILAEFVIIPRADLPGAHDGPHEGYARTTSAGNTYESAFYRDSPDAPASDPEWHQNRARHHIALAEFLEGKKAETAAAEAKRNARRDELARELGEETAALIRGRQDLSEVSLRAVDRIIELEEAAA